MNKQLSYEWIDATTENDIRRLLADSFAKYQKNKQKVITLGILEYMPGKIISYKVTLSS